VSGFHLVELPRLCVPLILVSFESDFRRVGVPWSRSSFKSCNLGEPHSGQSLRSLVSDDRVSYLCGVTIDSGSRRPGVSSSRCNVEHFRFEMVSRRIRALYDRGSFQSVPSKGDPVESESHRFGARRFAVPWIHFGFESSTFEYVYRCATYLSRRVPNEPGTDPSA
jgi:hypothetical protein